MEGGRQEGGQLMSAGAGRMLRTLRSVAARPLGSGRFQASDAEREGRRRDGSKAVSEEECNYREGTPRVANTPAIWNNPSCVLGRTGG